MNQPSVQQSLERLRQEIASAEPLNPEFKAKLAELDADIQRALAGNQTTGLRDRARDLSVRFAGQHPTAAAVLRELGVLLEGIGA